MNNSALSKQQQQQMGQKQHPALQEQHPTKRRKVCNNVAFKTSHERDTFDRLLGSSFTSLKRSDDGAPNQTGAVESGPVSVQHVSLTTATKFSSCEAHQASMFRVASWPATTSQFMANTQSMQTQHNAQTQSMQHTLPAWSAKPVQIGLIGPSDQILVGMGGRSINSSELDPLRRAGHTTLPVEKPKKRAPAAQRRRNEAEKSRIRKVACAVAQLQDELALHANLHLNPHTASRQEILDMTLQQLTSLRLKKEKMDFDEAHGNAQMVSTAGSSLREENGKIKPAAQSSPKIGPFEQVHQVFRQFEAGSQMPHSLRVSGTLNNETPTQPSSWPSSTEIKGP